MTDAEQQEQLHDYEQIKRIMNPDQAGITSPETTPVAQRLLEFFWEHPQAGQWWAEFNADKPKL